MIRSRRALPLLWALVAGCAAHGGPRALPPGHPPVELPPGHPPLGAGHGRPGPGHGARPFPFPLRDGHTGDPLPAGSLLTRLEAARVVYAGERHTDAASHDVQLALLGRLFALDRSVALGIEMLPREAQPALDAYLDGRLDEDAFLKQARWEERWGYDFGLYRPLFSFCRAHGLRIYALNAPHELVRAVRRAGVAGLSPAERAALPGGYPWPQPEAHRAYLREVFSQHAHMGPAPAGGARAADKAPDGATGKADAGAADKASDGATGKGEAPRPTPEERFGRFYLAQLVWDETMAEGVARVLQGPAAPRRLLVLAGTGHVGVHAVPARAARRGVEPGLTVAPTEATSGPPPGGAQAVDVLAVVSD